MDHLEFLGDAVEKIAEEKAAKLEAERVAREELAAARPAPATCPPRPRATASAPAKQRR